MKKIKKIISILTILLLILLIFFKSQIVNTSISFSLKTFINNLFPSLFPMFIISDLLICLNIPTFLGNTLSKISHKIFNTTPLSSYIFFLSLITGFPSQAKYINDLLISKNINEQEASNILSFSFFANPLFIINTVGVFFLNNKKIGIIMFICNIIANIITGIITKDKEKYFYKKIEIKRTANQTLTEALFKSLKTSTNVMLQILVTITFTSLILSLIKSTINLNEITNIIMSCLFELTTGIKLLSQSSIPKILIYLLTMFSISFGGLSVHAQIFSILNNKKIKYSIFLKNRILCSLISTALFYLIYIWS